MLKGFRAPSQQFSKAKLANFQSGFVHVQECYSTVVDTLINNDAAGNPK